jgi:hypothetical protein
VGGELFGECNGLMGGSDGLIEVGFTGAPQRRYGLGIVWAGHGVTVGAGGCDPSQQKGTSGRSHMHSLGL